MTDPVIDNSDWKAALPDEIREASSLADIKTIEDMAKGYVHAQSLVGRDKVVLPTKDSTPEELSEFYNKLGRPESADGYSTPTENMPENVQLDDALIKSFYEEAHRMGMNEQQAAALIRWQAQMTDQSMQANETAVTQELKDAEALLKKEFGNAYDDNIAIARQAAQEFGGDDLVTMLNETGLGNDPSVVKMLVAVGKAVGSDEVLGKGGRGGFTPTPFEAQAQIDEKMLDPDFMAAYEDKDHAGHNASVDVMTKLFAFAHPEPKD